MQRMCTMYIVQHSKAKTRFKDYTILVSMLMRMVCTHNHHLILFFCCCCCCCHCISLGSFKFTSGLPHLCSHIVYLSSFALLNFLSISCLTHFLSLYGPCFWCHFFYPPHLFHPLCIYCIA